MRARLAIGTVTVVIVGALSTCSAPPEEPVAAGTLVELSFDDTTLDAALSGNTGEMAVHADVVTENGAVLQRVAGRNGGWALRFPSFEPSAAGGRAVVRLVPANPTDAFSPGGSDFTFGATFRLDTNSQGAAGDDGDNLVQFGRYGSPAQYKLDIDGRSPSCRVKGDLGAVTVKSGVQVSANDWFAVTCRREGEAVTLTTIRYGVDGVARRWSSSAAGKIGTVTLPDSRMALSIGGKLTASGNVDSSSDQFNGLIDDVVLRFLQ